jgi:membrane protease subunit HflC
MSMKKTLAWVIPAVLILAVILLAASMFYTVQENEHALVIRFSAVTEIVSESGLHFKLPIDEVRKYPKTKIFYDIPPSSVLTSDTKNMMADSFVVWRIENPFNFYTILGTIARAESRLDASTYSALQKLVSMRQQNTIISTDEKSRDSLNTEVFNIVRQECAEYGIEILDVKIKRFELPEDNEQSVFQRMISDRNQLAESFRADGVKQAALIRNSVDREANIMVSDAKAEAEKIIAEGEAEYIRILTEAYNTPERQEFYSFTRGLDALKKSLNGGEKTVILDKDSALAQILINP